jgi:tetratricopeptide (TPR) repeat protein
LADLSVLFQYLVVVLLAVWTARLAITKRRNGWAWGGVALILGLLPFQGSGLIAALPVFALMFIKLPSEAPAAPDDRLACARCAKSHSAGQHFCTGCGWDLNGADSPQEPDRGKPILGQPQVPTTVTVTVDSQSPETTESPGTELDTLLEDETVPADDRTSEPDLEADGEEPDNAHVPWGTYDVGVAPTAAVMVSRGIERFDEGKFQEAIDQFTKAIALDPNYADAWERRSVAYAQLGRPQQAEDDRRHLQGLDPSSSPG